MPLVESHGTRDVDFDSRGVDDAQLELFAETDDNEKKTLSRRFVEGYLQHFRWYFPRKKTSETTTQPNNHDAPSLAKAWAYYEHIALPRRIEDVSTINKHVFRRAEQGETKQETELYEPFSTPQTAFIEWGVGIDLYFFTLYFLAIVFLIVGFFNVSNIYFYASSSYTDESRGDLPIALHGSAVCEGTEWVVCPTCNAGMNRFSHGRYATAQDNTTILVRRRTCEGGADMEQGMVNWASLVFIAICMFFLSFYLHVRGVRFDEDKVTCSDYSVVVHNPPIDAYDPDEWRDFFSQFAEKQVTAVTVALKNEYLLRKLVERRKICRELGWVLPPGTDLSDEDVVRNVANKVMIKKEAEERQSCFGKSLSPLLRMLGLFPNLDMLVDKLSNMNMEIQELQQQDYDVTEVFVTFETEEGQRNALSALSVGKLDISRNNTRALGPSAVFRGEKVLDVDEPPEPSAVRWLDLSRTMATKLMLRSINLALTVAIVAVAGYLVELTRVNVGTSFAGPMISVFNVIIPNVVKLLMKMERHSSEGDFQASLYLKITLFRWVNTALLVRLITPLETTLGGSSLDLLPSVNSILRSELIVVPLLRLSDIGSNIKKHLLAPRARTQEEMNLNFLGTPNDMGERYTDLTKVLFLCFVYSSLHPLVFFYGAAIFIIQYYVDKFCLMRIWRSAPSIGPELSVFSRRYMFSTALLAFAIASSYTYAQFPYDNICDYTMEGQQETGFAGHYPGAFLRNGTVMDINVTQDESVAFCPQEIRKFNRAVFPAVPWIQPPGLKWMTGSQETLTHIYGWTSVVALVIFYFVVFGGTFIEFFVSFFKSTYEPDGESQHIDLSNIPDIAGYVPEIKEEGFEYPFIACDMSGVDESLMGWEDPNNSFDFHNLIFDVPLPEMEDEQKSESSKQDGSEDVPEDSSHDDETTADVSEHKNNKGSDGTARQWRVFAKLRHYPPAWQHDEIKVKEEHSGVEDTDSTDELNGDFSEYVQL